MCSEPPQSQSHGTMCWQVSWKEDVLGDAVRLSKLGIAAVQANPSPAIRALQWLPGGAALLAMDRVGTLCAIDSAGFRLSLNITASASKVLRPSLPSFFQ